MACRVVVVLGVLSVLTGFVSATPLLGGKQCTWGPTYWCSNITNAKECGAVKHCIKAVWEKQAVVVDNDDICKICVDMVTQARDQLESNQTQQDLKDVFEGSCELIPIKIVAKECIKLVDDFIPELIETLASQMDPQVVCTVSGMCNNARIDKLIAEQAVKSNSKNVQLCNGCFSTVGKMRNNFDKTTYEKFLENSLRVCRNFGSLSDGCSTAVFTHFEDLYSHLVENLYPENVCHVLGTCAYKFHQHEPEVDTDSSKLASVEITPMGKIGRLDVSDDTPCQLCEQLVIHARDILVANTTEEEFKRVMIGICGQTGNFKDECLAIVNQFYPAIYNFLVKELDPNAICFMIGICHKGVDEDVPIAPLLPSGVAELAVKIMKNPSHGMLIGKDETNSYKDATKNVKIEQPELAQLPIERLMIQLPENKELCTFCQYLLHFIQEQISDAQTEESIKAAVEKSCNVLPSAIKSQCEAFIEAYGNAVIALLVQEIDPSQVCPALTLCSQAPDVPKINVLMNTGKDNKPNCPLCLFAVEQLESMLKANRTEENIEQALKSLCSYLPKNLQPECDDFVNAYSKQLVEMLASEFTPQEVCVYLKLCVDKKPDNSLTDLLTPSRIDIYHNNMHLMADRNNYRKPILPASMLAKPMENEIGELIATNEIPDNTYNGQTLIYAEVSSPLQIKASPQCIICEFIMTQLDKELQDKRTEEEIKHAIHGVCKILPKHVKQDCDDFIEKYADLVLSLLVNELTPAEICATMGLCVDKQIDIQNTVFECAVCSEVIDLLERVLKNRNVDHRIEHIIEKTCYALPKKYVDKCIDLMGIYGEKLIYLVLNYVDSSKICGKIGICGDGGHMYPEFLSGSDINLRSKRSPEQQKLGAKKCTWGPSYWCANVAQANECHALEHCRQHIWKGDEPIKA